MINIEAKQEDKEGDDVRHKQAPQLFIVQAGLFPKSGKRSVISKKISSSESLKQLNC